MKQHLTIRNLAIAAIFLTAAAGYGYGQAPGGAGGFALAPQGPPMTAPGTTVVGPQAAGPFAPQVLTFPGAQGSQALQQMTPAQRSAAEAELARTGGQLTPQAIDALRARPDFKNLSPDEIVKGKELLDKKENEPEKKEALEKEKTVIGQQRKISSLFDRYRMRGKYQEISTDLRPFGYDFFAGAGVSIATDRKDVPVPSKYVVGPGDEVKILMWGRVNGQYNLTIDRNGNITLPQVGPLHIAGLSFEQMASYLIKQSEQIVGANIDITMGALKTIPIFVLGDVARPGAYTIGSFATITDALIIAGGPSNIGSMRKVQLRRKDKLITTFDLYDLLIRGDKSKDIMLEAGDVIFAPVVECVVGVAGNVRRPAIYELKDKKDLHNLFDLAGGIIPTAYTQQIQVERVVKNEREIVVDIDDMNLTKSRSTQLQDGDLVKVFNIVEKDVNAVIINGNVKRPGKYEYRQGMRLKDLLKSPADLLPDTHLEYGLIKRMAPPELKTELIPFSPKKLLIDNDGPSNIALMPLDQVFVFSKWFFRDRPFVRVEGEVRKAVRRTFLDFTDADQEYKRAFTGDFPSRIRGEAQPGSAGGEDAGWVRDVRTEESERARPDYAEKGEPLPDRIKADLAQKGELQPARTRPESSQKGEPPVEAARPGIRIDLTEKMTIRDAVTAAGGLTRDAYLAEAELYRTDWSTKQVTLLRFNVTKALEGEPGSNLTLKDLDRIVIHSQAGYAYKKTVSVDGAILKPGVYPYAEKMTVKDLIFASGNVLESAYLAGAEVSSQIIVDDKLVKIEHRTINLRKALEGSPEDNIFLRPYDRLSVKALSNWGKERFATVTGEVRFPGAYVLRDGEKLSDLIERAGGYKETAYLRGSVFVRQSVKELQQKNMEEMITRMERELLAESSTINTSSPETVQTKQIELQQKQAFIESLRRLKATGRMTVRVANLRLLRGSDFDIPLENGDSLFIPIDNKVVNVMGAVMANASLIYADRIAPKDYIKMAGGYSRYADLKHTYVLKVDGSATKLSSGMINWNDSRDRWEMAGFGTDERPVESGDTIVVPEKLERIAWLREIKDITQILAQLATATGIVYLITK